MHSSFENCAIYNSQAGNNIPLFPKYWIMIAEVLLPLHTALCSLLCSVCCENLPLHCVKSKLLCKTLVLGGQHRLTEKSNTRSCIFRMKMLPKGVKCYLKCWLLNISVDRKGTVVCEGVWEVCGLSLVRVFPGEHNPTLLPPSFTQSLQSSISTFLFAIMMYFTFLVFIPSPLFP